MRLRFVAALAAVLTMTALATVATSSPASASSCVVPAPATVAAYGGRQGCGRVDVTRRSCDPNSYWISRWSQDTIDPFSDNDRTEVWVRYPKTGTWVRLASDQNSADFNPNSSYHLASTSVEGNPTQVQAQVRFSDQVLPFTVPVNFLWVAC